MPETRENTFLPHSVVSFYKRKHPHTCAENHVFTHLAQNPRVLNFAGKTGLEKSLKNLKKMLAFCLLRLYSKGACLRKGNPARSLPLPAKTQKVAALSGNFCRELSARRGRRRSSRMFSNEQSFEKHTAACTEP